MVNFMIKKTYSLLAFLFISMTAFGASVNELTSQLTHIQAQIKAVKVSWQKAEKTLQNIKKLLTPALYQHAEDIAHSILAFADVNTKMKILVDQQLEAIVLYKEPYKAINYLTDYFSEKIKALNQPMRIICMAIANKAYRLLLGKKLTIKEKELLLAIAEVQKNEDGQKF